MKLILDAKKFSSDLRLRGFILLTLSAFLLIVLSIYLITNTPSQLTNAHPVVYVWTVGFFVFFLVFAIFLKTHGMLFNIPLKFFDKAIQLQPVFSITPKSVKYTEITSIELWYGLSYRKSTRGCSILSSDGSFMSVETFSDKESLKKLVEEIRPLLEGLRLKVDEEETSIVYTFLRDLRTKKLN